MTLRVSDKAAFCTAARRMRRVEKLSSVNPSRSLRAWTRNRCLISARTILMSCFFTPARRSVYFIAWIKVFHRLLSLFEPVEKFGDVSFTISLYVF